MILSAVLAGQTRRSPSSCGKTDIADEMREQRRLRASGE
jgi:hypothetical protein